MKLPQHLLPAALALALAGPPAARAQVLYQIDGVTTGYAPFNNSAGAEAEDNFVANSYQVVPGGERINSFTTILGSGLTNQQIFLAVYRGSSLTNPQAGTGLTRIHTSVGTVTTTQPVL